MAHQNGTASAVRHSTEAILEAALVAAVIVALLVAVTVLTGSTPGASPALAGGKTGPTTNGVTITVPDGPFGGTTLATVKGGSGYWMHVVCSTSSGNQMVDWEPTDANGQATIALGPTSSWSSGTATCRADAGKFDRRSKFQVAASTTFKVY